MSFTPTAVDPRDFLIVHDMAIEFVCNSIPLCVCVCATPKSHVLCIDQVSLN